MVYIEGFLADTDTFESGIDAYLREPTLASDQSRLTRQHHGAGSRPYVRNRSIRNICDRSRIGPHLLHQLDTSFRACAFQEYRHQADLQRCMQGMVTRQLAETENNMNAVERLTYYAGPDLPQEAAYEISETAPPATWPDRGEIVFDTITMAYRPDLPPVLKGMYVTTNHANP